MCTKEKILLLETLMDDIRGGWDGGKLKRYKDKRVWMCLKLIKDFTIISRDYNHKDNRIVADLDWFKFHQALGVYLAGSYEGRYLRMSICDGGYEGLDKFHGLNPSFSMRSKEFCKTVKQLCRNDYGFFNK